MGITAFEESGVVDPTARAGVSVVDRSAAGSASEPADLHADLGVAAGERMQAGDVIRDLVTTHELERRRIALDLHDVVGQALTAVRLNLEHLSRGPVQRRTDAELRRSVSIVDQAIQDVRDLAFDLRPAILDDLGLVAAARWYTARQARLGGYRHVFRADRLISHVGVEVEAACFRTLQEALTNVVRHARATRVQVELVHSAGDLTLVVEDDGVGFDPRRLRRRSVRHPTLGLIGAAERVSLVGGSLEVTSRPGSGTRFRARFPSRACSIGSEAPP